MSNVADAEKSKSKVPSRKITGKKNPDEKKILQMVEFQPSDVIKYRYHGQLIAEYKEDLTIYNPTDSIVAFKLKGTSPKMIKISPGYGYLKPKGRVTIWVIISPDPNQKPPNKEHVSTLMSIAPQNSPPNPHHYWNGKAKQKSPLRKTVKLQFVEEKEPLKQPPKVPVKPWVDRIKKHDDDDESECGDTTGSEN